MQKIVLFLLFLICGATTYSQQPNYIYIEAEKGQLFYVKIKDKVYSAETGGYIIIPNLTEDNYVLNIGFPKNIFPEQRFTINLNKNDRGFLLKNLGDKGWELFDLQTMALITSDNVQSISDPNEVKKTDAFSTLLSKVVNDPAVLVENKKTPVKTAAASPSGDSAETRSVTHPAIVAATTPTTQTTTTTVKESKPVKLSEQQTESAYEAVYVADGADTIRISYPIDKSIMTAPPATPLINNKEPDIQNTPGRVSTTDSTVSEKPAIKIINSDCKNFANDQDVDKLRVRIMKEGDMDNKLSIAKKYFRTKCFTVKQIIALAELFTQDENRYQFFEIAYPFISDAENFPQLEDELKQDYYKNRFRAMIKK